MTPPNTVRFRAHEPPWRVQSPKFGARAPCGGQAPTDQKKDRSSCRAVKTNCPRLGTGVDRHVLCLARVSSPASSRAFASPCMSFARALVAGWVSPWAARCSSAAPPRPCSRSSPRCRRSTRSGSATARSARPTACASPTSRARWPTASPPRAWSSRMARAGMLGLLRRRRALARRGRERRIDELEARAGRRRCPGAPT